MAKLPLAEMSASENVVPALYVGHHESLRTSIVDEEFYARAVEAGYDFVTAPITTPAFVSKVTASVEKHLTEIDNSEDTQAVSLPTLPPLTLDDTDLNPGDFLSSVTAVISPWIDLSSRDPLIAHVSRQVFNLEIAYAAFCGVSNILIHGPIDKSNTIQYARAIQDGLGVGPYIQISVLMPMFGELEQDISEEGTHLAEFARSSYLSVEGMGDEDEDGDDLYATWDAWNSIRTVCKHSAKVSVVLELPRQLPPINLQSRWYSEPIRMLMLPRTSFLRNAKGYPVLSKAHQEYLARFLRLRYSPWVLLSDVSPLPIGNDANLDPTPAEAAAQPTDSHRERTLHLEYLRHLQHGQPPRPAIERFGQGYQDLMQSPLQPLTDNLESITYEVFERDPVKYEWYERAVALALKDLKEKIADDRPLIVAVVGAGRGPLVTRVLQASQSTDIKVDCWAVEKNPNAFVLLQRRNATDPLWNKQVSVVKSDMRTWPGPQSSTGTTLKADIIVSELLGSFADNELSPECLDGVQHVLHPDHGISIPQSYSAHLTPIASPKLHADLLSRLSTDLNTTVTDKWELPYVVMLHQYDFLSLRTPTPEDPRIPNVLDAWSFSHPIAPNILTNFPSPVGGDGNTNIHNTRTCTLRFPCADRGVCHGLAGYFEAVLYSASPTAAAAGQQTIELSTNPVTMAEKSKDMISWFPIFFPLRTPVYVPEDGELEVRMWRATDGRKVWYEWVVEVFALEPITGQRGGEGGEGGGGESGTVSEAGSTIGRGKRRRKVGMSEVHSSWRNGCLM